MFLVKKDDIMKDKEVEANKIDFKVDINEDNIINIINDKNDIDEHEKNWRDIAFQYLMAAFLVSFIIGITGNGHFNAFINIAVIIHFVFEFQVVWNIFFSKSTATLLHKISIIIGVLLAIYTSLCYFVFSFWGGNYIQGIGQFSDTFLLAGTAVLVFHPSSSSEICRFFGGISLHYIGILMLESSILHSSSRDRRRISVFLHSETSENRWTVCLFDHL